MNSTKKIKNNVTHYGYIDFLRGLAIVLVISVHCALAIPNLNLFFYFFNYGQMGVQLFFMVSAITLCMSMNERKEVEIKSFYIRRYFRIAPMYYIGIIIYFLWIIFKDYFNGRPFVIPDGYHLHQILLNIFFVHGLFPDSYNSTVPGGWSIATEMMFYAIFPILFNYSKKTKLNEFIYSSIIISAILLIFKLFLVYDFFPSFVGHELIGVSNFNFEFLNLSLLNQFSVFLLGIIGYRLIKLESYNLSFKVIVASSFLAILSGYFLNVENYQQPIISFFQPLLSGLSFLALILAAAKYRFTNTIYSAFVNLGKFSFSIYILHFLILDLINYFFRKIIFFRAIYPLFAFSLLVIIVTLISYFVAKFFFFNVERRGVIFGKNFLLKNSY